MVRLKEGETYVSFSAKAATTDPRDGVFRRDTRYLSAYSWNHGDAVTLLMACEENRLHQHLAVVGPDRAQAISMVRLLTMRNDGFDDRWTIANTSRYGIPTPSPAPPNAPTSREASAFPPRRQTAYA
jgi:hypothetical protein